MGKIICNRCRTENTERARYCSGCGYELPRSHTAAAGPSPALPKDNKKNIWPSVAGVVVSMLTFFAVQQLFFKTPSFDKALMKIASEINLTCPIMLDADTRFDNAVALPGNTLQYSYTLINFEKELIDTLDFQQTLEPGIINNISTSPDMKYLREHNTTFRYYYKDKTGSYVCCIWVKPDQYQ